MLNRQVHENQGQQEVGDSKADEAEHGEDVVAERLLVGGRVDADRHCSGAMHNLRRADNRNDLALVAPITHGHTFTPASPLILHQRGAALDLGDAYAPFRSVGVGKAQVFAKVELDGLA